jgi:hypothetical protein
VELNIKDDSIANPFDSEIVERALTGIQKDEAIRARDQVSKKEDSPALTLDMLAAFKPHLLGKPSTSFTRMRWAAIRLGVTGLLRPNEFIGAYRQEQRAMRPNQITFRDKDNRTAAAAPTRVFVDLHNTKADSLGKNAPICITDEETVDALWKWAREREALEHTAASRMKFFAFKNQALSGQNLRNALNHAARRCGWFNAKFQLRCFRRGGASTLMAAGASTPTIMSAGRWRTSAMVQRYTDRESKEVANRLKTSTASAAATSH